MASHELIDAKFDHAVQIVQSLPKTGPIQTDYEEKLMMYSLFKQGCPATVGNVKGSRPGIWDMLGRAKWDAWAKHKDLDPYEAKHLYVEALIKVLRKYSEKTVAKNLVEELVTLGGSITPSSIDLSRMRSPGSDFSGSTTSHTSVSAHRPEAPMSRPHLRNTNAHHGNQGALEGELEDEARDLPMMNPRPPQVNRPPSSSTSERYRTPLAGSMAMSPLLSRDIPSQQPLPSFETPAAFVESETIYPSSLPLDSFYRRSGMTPPRGISRNQTRSAQQFENGKSLERAVENIQIQFAALSERLEILETRSNIPSINLHEPGGSSFWLSGSGHSPLKGRAAVSQWDMDDLGMWSLVFNPLSRGIQRVKELAVFFARNERRSPSMIIVRRLCLDVSFLLTVITILRSLWIRSGARRREVKAALVILWRAIVGSRPPRDHLQHGI